jgi:hypothetical protein
VRVGVFKSTLLSKINTARQELVTTIRMEVANVVYEQARRQPQKRLRDRCAAAPNAPAVSRIRFRAGARSPGACLC